jgi:tetratricopeptide (TPR) repeat protein
MGINLDTEIEEKAEKMLEIAKREGDFPKQLTILQNLADEMEDNNLHERALIFLEEAEKIAEKQGKIRQRVLIMCSMSGINLDLENYLETMRLCSTGMEICQRHEFEMEKVDLMTQMALAYGIKKDYVNEVQLLNQVLEIVQDAGNKRREMVILDMLLDTYKKMNETDEIVVPYQERWNEISESLEISDKILEKLDKIPPYLESGKINKAFELLNKLMKKVVDEGDTQSIANVYTMFATAYADLKDYKNALKYMLDCLELHKKVWSLGAIPFCQANIANFHWNLGNKEEARKFAEAALAFCEEFGVEPDEMVLDICKPILNLK